jgi:hypothetical protein
MKTKLLKTNLMILMLIAFVSNLNALTATTSGDWSNAATWGGIAPGTTVTGQDIDIPAGITVNLDVPVTFSGLLNTFMVNGTLSGAQSLTIDQGSLSGAGTINVMMMTFNTLAGNSFTGTITANVLKNAGATLLLTSAVNVMDTLNLDAGSVVLNTGANLSPMANSTIRVNNGTLTVGGGVFNSAVNYNVMYVGGSKTTGIELATTMMQDLHVMLSDNAQVLTVANDVVVHGLTHLEMGSINLSGMTITMRGDFMAGMGAMITTNATSNVLIEGMSGLSSGLSFSAGSAVNDLKVDLTGAGSGVMLMGPLNVAGNLRLNDGDLNLQAGSTLTMNAGSTIHVEDGMMNVGSGMFDGTASYNVEYMGGSVTTGQELSGMGLNNLTIALMPATGVVTLAGDLTVNGVFNLTAGTLMLNGNDLMLNGTMNTNAMGWLSSTAMSDLHLNLDSSASDTLYFAPAGNVLSDLVINIAAGTPVVLGSPLEIATSLNFMSGKINLHNSRLTIQSAAMITGFSDTRYVITAGLGKLEMNVNMASPYVVFPVGTVQNFSPASIQQTALGSTGNFMVGVVNDVYAGGYTGASVVSTNSLITRTWFIDAASGVIINMNLKLGWMPATEVNGFNRASSYISHYTTMWDSVAPAAAMMGSFGTYEATRMGINNLNTSAFSVMDKRVVSGVDELSEGTLALYPNPASDFITIENSDANVRYMIDVLDVTGKLVLKGESVQGKTSLDVSSLDKGYYFIRATSADGNKSGVKRFIKS